MDASPETTAPSIAALLVACLDVCTRLEARVSRQNSSPLNNLVQSQVIRCVEGPRELLQSLNRGEFHILDTHQLDVTTLWERLIDVSRLISETLDLVNFGSSVDRPCQWEALDTIYAHQNILSRTKSSYYCSSVRAFRIAEDLMMSVSSFSRTTDAELVECLSTSNPLEFVHRATAQFFPRYVHLYNNRGDCPYISEATADQYQGGFGIVRKVTHNLLGHIFAEKTLRKVFSDADRNEIKQEVGVLQVCHHQNIVQFVDAYEIESEPNVIYIVMRPWAPFTLDEFLHCSDGTRQSRCPWFGFGCDKSDHIIIRMMSELADAVAYLHHLSIKHKDIKPDNILLQHPGTNNVTPILTDVGRSKVFSEEASTDFSKQGSYQFQAPEQLDSLSSTLKVDVWQLGCCFALLLAAAAGGTSAVTTMWHSVQDTGRGASCNIAREHVAFMRSFDEICSSRCVSPKWQQAYTLVTRMLDLDVHHRVCIETVLDCLQSIESEPCPSFETSNENI